MSALRGGTDMTRPGQKPAFDDALPQMGCPDRRIDRLCITCCLLSQPSHHAGCPARSRSRRKCGAFLPLVPNRTFPDPKERTPTLLIVDDETLICRTAGIKVLEASTADDAILI